MLENQQWAIRSTCAHNDTCTTQKERDLAESTGVVPAKYPPNVKLELLTTLECKRGVNYAYLGWWGYWDFYSSRVLTSPCWIRSLFLLGVSLGVFYGILFLKESLWVLSHAECKLFPYIHDTWVASNHWSVLSAFNTPPALTPSAPWGRQSHEGVSLRVPYEASRRFLSVDEYYGNWRTWNMPLPRIIVVNPCRHCKTLAYSWLQHLLIFLPHHFQWTFHKSPLPFWVWDFW